MPVPKGWLNYTCFGSVVEGTPFLAFKTPLRSDITASLRPEEQFGVDYLLYSFPKLGLVFDLTNTTRYYDSRWLTSRNVAYLKIFCEGRGTLPKQSSIDLFFNTADSFIEQNPGKLIGVHCTHGLNRTGFMICMYLVHRMWFQPQKAIEVFERARGHAIVRETYTNHILGITEPETPNNWPRLDEVHERTIQGATRQRWDGDRKQDYRNERPAKSWRDYGGQNYGSERAVSSSRSGGKRQGRWRDERVIRGAARDRRSQSRRETVPWDGDRNQDYRNERPAESWHDYGRQNYGSEKTVSTWRSGGGEQSGWSDERVTSNSSPPWLTVERRIDASNQRQRPTNDGVSNIANRSRGRWRRRK